MYAPFAKPKEPTQERGMRCYVILNEAERSEESKAEHQRFLAMLGMTRCELGMTVRIPLAPLRSTKGGGNDASLFNSDSRYRSSLRCLRIRENRQSPRKLRLPSNPLLKSSQGLDRDAGT